MARRMVGFSPVSDLRLASGRRKGFYATKILAMIGGDSDDGVGLMLAETVSGSGAISASRKSIHQETLSVDEDGD